jgi:hypothetical protein
VVEVCGGPDRGLNVSDASGEGHGDLEGRRLQVECADWTRPHILHSRKGSDTSSIAISLEIPVVLPYVPRLVHWHAPSVQAQDTGSRLRSYKANEKRLRISMAPDAISCSSRAAHPAPASMPPSVNCFSGLRCSQDKQFRRCMRGRQLKAGSAPTWPVRRTAFRHG